jgi:hypothetical protein
MLERLEMKYTGLYRIPTESEIAKKISSHFAKKKAGKVSTTRVKKLSVEIEEKIRAFMILYPNETGVKLEKRVSQSYNAPLPDKYIRKDVMDRVNSWRQSAKPSLQPCTT